MVQLLSIIFCHNQSTTLITLTPEQKACVRHHKQTKFNPAHGLRLCWKLILTIGGDAKIKLWNQCINIVLQMDIIDLSIKLLSFLIFKLCSKGCSSQTRDSDPTEIVTQPDLQQHHGHLWTFMWHQCANWHRSITDISGQHEYMKKVLMK